MDIILDYFVQYIGNQFVKRLTYKMSEWFQNLYIKHIVKGISRVLLNKNNNFVIHRDKDYLVINKPPNILINSNDSKKVTVQTCLKKQFPELCNLKLKHSFYFAHRLDFSTSGILCLPLNKISCTKISKAFENRIVDKYYVAIVNGHFREKIPCTAINFAIGEDARETESKKMCSTKSSGEFCLKPRTSKTLLYFCKNGYYNKSIPVAKVILKPITGRRHQLRVHCCDIGHPIFGDYTYGTTHDKKVDRMYLHAIRLIVPHQLELSTSDPFVGKYFEGLAIDLEDFYNKINIERYVI